MTATPAIQRAAPLFEGHEWTFDLLKRLYDEIEIVAREDLGLDVYPNQVEVISSEQMLDAYASLGMPILYRHWSFGKRLPATSGCISRGGRGLPMRSSSTRTPASPTTWRTIRQRCTRW